MKWNNVSYVEFSWEFLRFFICFFTLLYIHFLRQLSVDFSYNWCLGLACSNSE